MSSRIRVYLATLAALIAGMVLAGGMVASAGAAPGKQDKPGKNKPGKKKPGKKKPGKKKKGKKKKAKPKPKPKPKFKDGPRIVSAAPYKAGGSVGDAWVKDANPGTKLMLVNANNKVVRTGTADSFGSFIFYDVNPGATFTVRTPTGTKKTKVKLPKKTIKKRLKKCKKQFRVKRKKQLRKIKSKAKRAKTLKKLKRKRKNCVKRVKRKRINRTITLGQGTDPFQTLKPGDNPPASFYQNKELKPGLNYVTMRDGTELAMTVRLPLGKTMAQGPFPTFIEYSGYQTAAPHDLLTSFITGAAGQSDDLAPASSTAVGALIGPLLDFATVSVQMRGSGCSGGAFDLFGWPTTYDGYDAIETVAAQDWVEGKVGMGGISFSGITQLFTAGTQPPNLAAVAPLSVTDDVYAGTGFPGGIFNNGFAYSWITERAEEAKPAPEGGQPWAKAMTTTGDPRVSDPALREEQKQHCIANQRMRLQTRDYNALIEANPYRTPKLFEPRAPGAWVKNIDVPVYMVGAFQDEQTGGHWTEAVGDIPKSNPDVWVTMMNGVHVDSLGPSTFTGMSDFLNLFVGNGRVPRLNPLVTGLSPVLYQAVASSTALPILPTKYGLWLDTPANLQAARADFRQTNPRIRVLMDNGAALPGQPGAIGAKWETHFSDWPIPSIRPTTYFLGQGGALTRNQEAGESTVSYQSDPGARPARTLGENAQGDSWLAQPPYNWQPVADGKGLGFTSPALSQDTFIAGPSSLDLFLKSSQPNTDLQVTLTEVRPDGKETYVQNGWLRASHRALDEAKSTPYNPVQTWLEEDGAPLESGKFNPVRVQIFPAAHVFRAGSKIRVNIQAPGGDRTIWNFDTIENGQTTNTVGLGGAIPSKLVLPVIPNQTAQGQPLPAPTALRGQPSRNYRPASNGG
jgi:predicted acyl esterase